MVTCLLCIAAGACGDGEKHPYAPEWLDASVALHLNAIDECLSLI